MYDIAKVEALLLAVSKAETTLQAIGLSSQRLFVVSPYCCRAYLYAEVVGDVEVG